MTAPVVIAAVGISSAIAGSLMTVIGTATLHRTEKRGAQDASQDTSLVLLQSQLGDLRQKIDNDASSARIAAERDRSEVSGRLQRIEGRGEAISGELSALGALFSEHQRWHERHDLPPPHWPAASG